MYKRMGWDSNPRAPFGGHTLSRRSKNLTKYDTLPESKAVKFLDERHEAWVMTAHRDSNHEALVRPDDADHAARRSHPQNEVMTIRPSSVPAFISLNTWLMSSSFIS